METFDKIREIFGSWSNLAQLLQLEPEAVYMWKKRRRIPQQHCAEIVRLSQGQFTLHELRPDIYPLQRVA